jgi:hypothetical protein
MQKLWINLFAPALLLAAVAVVSSQEPMPMPKTGKSKSKSKEEPAPTNTKEAKEAAAKSKLEEMLEIALTHNPDIKVAEAKAREADAEVNRARLAVTQKVVQLYSNLESARTKVKRWQAEVERIGKLAATGAVDLALVNETEAQLVQAKAELAKLEAEVPYLVGEQNSKYHARVFKFRQDGWDVELKVPEDQKAAVGALGLWDITRIHSTVEGPMSDKLRAALDKPIALKLEKAKLEDVLAYFQKVHPEIVILNKDPNGKLAADASIASELPFGAALQWLEDSMHDEHNLLTEYRIVVREYGLLIVRRDQLPPDAVLLQYFWKANSKVTPKSKDEKK